MILTPQEAISILRLDEDVSYPQVDIILPAIDEYIEIATGKDWGSEETINALAKMTATILLVRWFEDPGAIGTVKENDHGFKSLIGQLEAKALVEAKQ